MIAWLDVEIAAARRDLGRLSEIRDLLAGGTAPGKAPPAGALGCGEG